MKNRYMGRKISVSRWTPTAIECYKRGCVCEGCIYNDFFEEDKCQCKYTVIWLVKVVGIPDELKKKEEELTL
jgi:hypothetical protein